MITDQFYTLNKTLSLRVASQLYCMVFEIETIVDWQTDRQRVRWWGAT